MTFEEISLSQERKLRDLSAMATEIVREHYDPLIGKAQNDYMIGKFQTVEAIREQLARGCQYYFAVEAGRRLGFLAFYPREDCLYLSKFYLYKAERGKGHSRQMLAFVLQNAREKGLRAVELNVNRNNSAVFAYEKLGFRRVRAEKNDIGEGYFMDDYIYRLSV